MDRIFPHLKLWVSIGHSSDHLVHPGSFGGVLGHQSLCEFLASLSRIPFGHLPALLLSTIPVTWICPQAFCLVLPVLVPSGQLRSAVLHLRLNKLFWFLVALLLDHRCLHPNQICFLLGEMPASCLLALAISGCGLVNLLVCYLLVFLLYFF